MLCAGMASIFLGLVLFNTLSRVMIVICISMMPRFVFISLSRVMLVIRTGMTPRFVFISLSRVMLILACKVAPEVNVLCINLLC